MTSGIDVADVRIVPVVVGEIGRDEFGVSHQMRSERISHAVNAPKEG